ncbi:MAG: hypothetical protein ACOCZ5_03670, partial [bacterium]
MSKFLNYSGLTYTEIVSQINNIFNSDPRFENFRESAIAQTIVEIFAGTVDLLNYNLERRAEECFIDTAKLKSSIILLAKQLGYVVQRPIPAEAKLNVRLFGDLTSKGIAAGSTMQIPIYSAFNYDGKKFILRNTFSYTFTEEDVANISSDGSDFEKNITVDDTGEDIIILQGERKSKVILGTTNQQIGEKFQLYKIDDKTFSNKYGTEDYDNPITTISVGESEESAETYSIDRRSIINQESLENFVAGDSKKVCLIRTSNDEKIELVFGDAQYAALGANVDGSGVSTSYDNIYINYLSTEGSKGNKVGIIKEKLDPDFSVFVDGNDITSNLEYTFKTNLTNGADLEDEESIKINAPNIYYSLDRLVSKKDYITYLKSLTSPINVKNAIAWGEQDEMINSSSSEPIRKLFNVVMFCVVGSLYNLENSPYSSKSDNDLKLTTLDKDYSVGSLNHQSYYNVYVKQDMVEQLEEYITSGDYYIAYGDYITVDFDEIQSVFTDGAELSFYYNSDYFLSSAPDELATVSNIDVSAASSEDEIASEIQTALRSFNDKRGTALINSNYDQLAFENITCEWDSVNSRFVISGDTNDACFIKQIDVVNSPELASYIGLAAIYSTKVNITNNNNIMSNKISTMIDKLNNRSQVTIKNVYVSPIIHEFNINGTIYIKKLSDRESLHIKIKDSIYTFLDKNADFNEEIYLSNIIDLIEKYSNVVHANIEIDPVN